MLIVLIRRLSPRGRGILGAVLFVLGIALVAVAAAVVHVLLIHGVAVTLIGAGLVAHSMVTRHRAKTTGAAGHDTVETWSSPTRRPSID